jgi:hypothetical protein
VRAGRLTWNLQGDIFVPLLLAVVGALMGVLCPPPPPPSFVTFLSNPANQKCGTPLKAGPIDEELGADW